MIGYIEFKPVLYPGALSDCAAATLQLIASKGVWIPDSKEIGHEQAMAITTLHRAKYIEYAAWGGWKVKGNRYTVGREAIHAAPSIPETRIRALLAAVGIESEAIRSIVECKSALRRPGNQPSYTVVLTRAAGVSNAALKAAGFADAVVNDRVIVVKVEEG